MKEKRKKEKNRWQAEDRREKEGSKGGREGGREGRKKGKALDVIIGSSVLLNVSQCIE